MGGHQARDQPLELRLRLLPEVRGIVGGRGRLDQQQFVHAQHEELRAIPARQPDRAAQRLAGMHGEVDGAENGAIRHTDQNHADGRRSGAGGACRLQTTPA